MKYQLSANDNPMLKRFSKPTTISRGLQVTVKECLCLDFGPSENLCHLHGLQRSGSGFDNLCFRSFTCEPVEKCPSADEGITKYKLFSAQTIDTFINKRAIILAWYLEYKKASKNLIRISPPNSPTEQPNNYKSHLDKGLTNPSRRGESGGNLEGWAMARTHQHCMSAMSAPISKQLKRSRATTYLNTVLTTKA